MLSRCRIPLLSNHLIQESQRRHYPSWCPLSNKQLSSIKKAARSKEHPLSNMTMRTQSSIHRESLPRRAICWVREGRNHLFHFQDQDSHQTGNQDLWGKEFHISTISPQITQSVLSDQWPFQTGWRPSSRKSSRAKSNSKPMISTLSFMHLYSKTKINRIHFALKSSFTKMNNRKEWICTTNTAGSSKAMASKSNKVWRPSSTRKRKLYTRGTRLIWRSFKLLRLNMWVRARRHQDSQIITFWLRILEDCLMISWTDLYEEQMAASSKWDEKEATELVLSGCLPTHQPIIIQLQEQAAKCRSRWGRIRRKCSREDQSTSWERE